MGTIWSDQSFKQAVSFGLWPRSRNFRSELIQSSDCFFGFFKVIVRFNLTLLVHQILIQFSSKSLIQQKQQQQNLLVLYLFLKVPFGLQGFWRMSIWKCFVTQQEPVRLHLFVVTDQSLWSLCPYRFASYISLHMLSAEHWLKQLPSAHMGTAGTLCTYAHCTGIWIMANICIFVNLWAANSCRSVSQSVHVRLHQGHSDRETKPNTGCL